MQVDVLKEEGLKRAFACAIAAEEVNAAVNNELQRIGKTVKIAGFRPGHIPAKILQQRYGQAVKGDVLKDLLTQGITNAINERSLRPALSPTIDSQDYEEGGDFKFTFSVELLPDVPNVDFSGITVDQEVFDIEESDIDEGLSKLAERSPNTKPLPESAKAENGNVVTMDFKGYVDGVAFEGGTAESFAIELGSGRLIEGFESQLVGLKAGDTKEVHVAFPQDYFNTDIAGKDAMFDVKVREVSALETPVVDDEFAKSKGFSDLRALREAVRDQLMKDYKGVVRTRLKKRLFDELEKQCSFPVPEGMLKMEFDSIWQRLQMARAQGDETVTGKSDDELREEYQTISERRVRLGILLAEIARKERLQVSREEMTRALIQHASQYTGQEQRVMDFYRQNPDRLDELRGPILEEKSVDWILSKVKLNDTKVSTQTLLEDEEGETSAEKPKAKAKKAPAKSKEKTAAEGEQADKAADAEVSPKPKAKKNPKPAASE